ncbi:MAG: outer membrane lipid asymmetry maintenance protein MlaD [bacterium]|nr:outer membrane lipid asymmetry maintenance protein MlaD [bacterium]
MPNSAQRDLLVGLFVLAGLVAIAYLSIQVGGANYAGPGGLSLTAYFDEVGGLAERAPVVVGGVKVGTVRRIDLDEEDFRAIVTLEVDDSLELPDDTSASILTAGVLGDQYLSLEPGGSPDLLGNGDTITYTQGAVVLERLIGKLLTSFGSGDGE